MIIFALFIILFGCLIVSLEMSSLRKDVLEVLTYIGVVLVMATLILYYINIVLSYT